MKTSSRGKGNANAIRDRYPDGLTTVVFDTQVRERNVITLPSKLIAKLNVKQGDFVRFKFVQNEDDMSFAILVEGMKLKPSTQIDPQIEAALAFLDDRSSEAGRSAKDIQDRK